MEGLPLIIHETEEDIPICEAFIRGACPIEVNCPYHHFHTPYLWQALISNRGQQVWSNLIEQNERIEDAYSSPWNTDTMVEVIVTMDDGSKIPVLLCISFDNMLGKIFSQLTPDGSTVQMRRLSTPSYCCTLLHGNRKEAVEQLQTVKYYTQWRFYVEEDLKWKSFEKTGRVKIPTQAVLESKYLHGQEIYRFSVEQAGAAAPQVFLLDFRLGCIVSPNAQSRWSVRRRPLFINRNMISFKLPLPFPEIKVLPYANTLPSNWSPLDTSQEYELVPLNPESVEFHLVASEFQKSLTPNRRICDIFRVQNPFLWNKYASKKVYMEQKGIPLNEKQLFHGTSDDSVVEAIFHHNFDWRMCGKNATMFGRGSYFANDAKYSDRYTGAPADSRKIRWMFLARVLVGRAAVGQKQFVRPPPLDPMRPHGELHNSCVDHGGNPRVFVIFETDQCYPEYVLSYRAS